jgi:hypothetical protein
MCWSGRAGVDGGFNQGVWLPELVEFSAAVDPAGKYRLRRGRRRLVICVLEHLDTRISRDGRSDPAGKVIGV